MAAFGGFPDWLRSLDPGEREQVAADALDWEEAARQGGAGGMVSDPWQDFDAWVAGAPDQGPLMVEPEDPYNPSLLWTRGKVSTPAPSLIRTGRPFASIDPRSLPAPRALRPSPFPAAPFRPADASASSVLPEQRGPAEPGTCATLRDFAAVRDCGAIRTSDQSGPADSGGAGAVVGFVGPVGSLAGRGVDPLLAAEALAGVDPATLDDEQVLDYVSVTGKMMSWLQARQYRAAAGFAAARPPVPGQRRSRRDRTGHPGTSKYAAAEVALVLNTSKEAALN